MKASALFVFALVAAAHGCASTPDADPAPREITVEIRTIIAPSTWRDDVVVGGQFPDSPYVHNLASLDEHFAAVLIRAVQAHRQAASFFAPRVTLVDGGAFVVSVPTQLSYTSLGAEPPPRRAHFVFELAPRISGSAIDIAFRVETSYVSPYSEVDQVPHDVKQELRALRPGVQADPGRVRGALVDGATGLVVLPLTPTEKFELGMELNDEAIVLVKAWVATDADLFPGKDQFFPGGPE